MTMQSLPCTDSPRSTRAPSSESLASPNQKSEQLTQRRAAETGWWGVDDQETLTLNLVKAMFKGEFAIPGYTNSISAKKIIVKLSKRPDARASWFESIAAQCEGYAHAQERRGYNIQGPLVEGWRDVVQAAQRIAGELSKQR